MISHEDDGADEHILYVPVAPPPQDSLATPRVICRGCLRVNDGTGSHCYGCGDRLSGADALARESQRYAFAEVEANGHPGRHFRFTGPGVQDRSGIACASPDDASYVRMLLEMAYEQGKVDAVASIRKAVGV